jgi:hypothetical protein
MGIISLESTTQEGILQFKKDVEEFIHNKKISKNNPTDKKLYDDWETFSNRIPQETWWSNILPNAVLKFLGWEDYLPFEQRGEEAQETFIRAAQDLESAIPEFEKKKLSEQKNHTQQRYEFGRGSSTKNITKEITLFDTCKNACNNLAIFISKANNYISQINTLEKKAKGFKNTKMDNATATKKDVTQIDETATQYVSSKKELERKRKQAIALIDFLNKNASEEGEVFIIESSGEFQIVPKDSVSPYERNQGFESLDSYLGNLTASLDSIQSKLNLAKINVNANEIKHILSQCTIFNSSQKPAPVKQAAAVATTVHASAGTGRKLSRTGR